jgi:capsular exopolysaccharide synthesis family protein
VISGLSSFDAAVQRAPVKDLSVLTAGKRSPNPAELLAGKGFGELINRVGPEFDRVVIDSAPVNAVSDTFLLVKYVQSVCVVVHAGKTPDKAVVRACEKLAAAGSKPVGFILNQLPKRAGSGYYYHYSAGAYGDVYGASEPAKA